MMSIHLVVLFVIATTYGSYGQTTPNNDMPIPVTVCGKRVLKCWNDQQAAMAQADAVFDFAAGCQKFKAYIDCYNGVFTDATCAKENEVISINMEVIASRGEICLTNGQVTPCGVLLQSCMNDVINIRNDYIKKNATAACPVQIKFQECADKIKKDPVCTTSSEVKTRISTLEDSLNEDDMIIGCSGTCGLLTGQCLGNLTDIMINGDFANMDWKQFCRDAYASLYCIYDLSTSGSCKGDSLVQSVSESQNLVLKDYCAGDGKPAPCIQQVRECAHSWSSSVGPNVTIKDQCQAALDYQDCIGRVVCSADMNEMLANLGQSIETDEGKKHCPTLGTCSDRLAVCDSIQEDMVMSNKTQTTEYCDLAKTAYSCFTLVRKNAECQSENINATKFESLLPATLKTVCGISVGGGAGHQMVSLVLMAAAVLFSGAVLW